MLPRGGSRVFCLIGCCEYLVPNGTGRETLTLSLPHLQARTDGGHRLMLTWRLLSLSSFVAFGLNGFLRIIAHRKTAI